MNKKKIIILCATLGVVICVSLLVFVFVRNKSVTTNTNEETENNTINGTIDNVVDDDMVKTEENTEENTEEQQIEQPENNTNNQKTNTNTNVNTNISSTPVENNNSHESQDSTSTELQNATTPSNPKVESETLTINYGDVNGDGTINGKDTTLIRRYIDGKQEFTESHVLVADLNTDGVVDDVDVDIIRKVITGYDIKLPYNSGNKYNITYELNGGSVSNNETLRRVYASISSIETLPTLTKDEYVFIGWTGSNGNIPELNVTPQADVAQNLHYVANWKLYGDVNEDGVINGKDTTLIRRYINGEQYFTKSQQLAADVNADGVVNDLDVEVLRKFVSGEINKFPYNS